MDLERFGKIVYARRNELGLSQQGVADNGGPTDTTIGKIENGEWTPGNRKATLRKLDIGLEWEPGSARRTLEGGTPTPINSVPSTTVLAGQLFHPSRRSVTASIVANDTEVARVLEDMLSKGRVDETDRSVVERALGDARIAAFPAVFESLSRDGKLEVARFGAQVQANEIKQQLMEGDCVMETSEKPDASGEAHKDEEAALLNEPEPGPMVADVFLDTDPVPGSVEDPEQLG